MLKYVVEVKLNSLHTQRMSLPPWEVPILEAVHEPGNVTVVDEVFDEQLLPDPQAEYDRLLMRYKAHSENPEMPYVAEVYGQHGAGVRRLADEMAASQPGSTPARTAPAEPVLDIEPILEGNADAVISRIRQLDDLDALSRIADETTGDGRKTVRAAADERIGELAELQAAG